MVYALNDLKMLSQDELINFFAHLLLELNVESYMALLTLEDKTEVLNLLKLRGFDIDEKTPQGASLLHYAASVGLVHAVDAFLSMGYANDITKSGANLGHYAAQSGHTEAIKTFLRKGLLEINAKDYYGASFILYAARGGHINTIKSLIEMGVDKDETSSKGAGAIHYAVLGAGITHIEALIELGYSPQDLDRYGDSVLHYAARFGKSELISLFIEKYGLNPAAENIQGETILDLAGESGCQKTIMLCSKYLTSTTTFM